jgi:hypothetical protein
MHCRNRFRHNGSGRPAAVLPRHPLIVVSRPIRPRRQPTPSRNLRRILARKPSAPGLHAKPAPWRDRQPATADRQLCSSHKNGQGPSTDLGRRLNSLCLQLLPATTGRHGRRMRVSVSTPHSRACWMRSYALRYQPPHGHLQPKLRVRMASCSRPLHASPGILKPLWDKAICNHTALNSNAGGP